MFCQRGSTLTFFLMRGGSKDPNTTKRELNGSVVECLTRDRGVEPHWRHRVVSLSKNIKSA